MTPAKLRADAEAELGAHDLSCEGDGDSACERQVRLARAALALAELLPVLDALISARNRDAMDLDNRNHTAKAVRDLDRAWTKAKESLQ